MSRHPRPPGHNGHANPALLLTLVHGELAHIAASERTRLVTALSGLLSPALLHGPERALRIVEALAPLEQTTHALYAAALARRGMIEDARRALATADSAPDASPSSWAAFADASAALGDPSGPKRALLAAEQHASSPAWREDLCAIATIYHAAGRDDALRDLLLTRDPTSAQLQLAAAPLARALAALVAQDQFDAAERLWACLAERIPHSAATIIYPRSGASLAMRGHIGLAIVMLEYLEPLPQANAVHALLDLLLPLGQRQLIEALASWLSRQPRCPDLATACARAGHIETALAMLADGPPHDKRLRIYTQGGLLDEAIALLASSDATLLDPTIIGLCLADAPSHTALELEALAWARRQSAPERRALATASLAVAMLAQQRTREAELLAAEALDAAHAAPRNTRAHALLAAAQTLASGGGAHHAAHLLSDPATRPVRDPLAAAIAAGYARAGDVAGAARCLALMSQGIARLEAAAACYHITAATR
jgi:hypothetical protein